MKRRTLLAGATAFAAAPAIGRAAEKTRVVWWHAMTAALADEVARIADAFNASQDASKSPDLQGRLRRRPDCHDRRLPRRPGAASRADLRGRHRHHADRRQGGEAGLGTGKETGVTIDPNSYIASVRGYYSLADGRMASMPFNSSTAVMWYNKDAFRKAAWIRTSRRRPGGGGRPPQAIKAKGAARNPDDHAWPTWIQLEQYSALHDLPFATKADGFNGLDASAINSKPHVKHIARLLDMAGTAPSNTPAATTPDPLLVSGQAGIHFDRPALRGDLVKNANFDWAEAYLPYDPEIIKTPLNSIIGGASLWPMTAPGRTPAEYKAVARS